MKKLLPSFRQLPLLLLALCLQNLSSSAQCVNADFESGNFNNWTGTWGLCSGGNCTPITGWPYLNAGFNQGANNAPLTASENQFIMTGAGFDPTIGGTSIPVVYPGSGGTSMRLGTTVANLGSGRGETMSYSYTVNNTNNSFTYHYAVVLNDAAGHSVAEQPYFKILMYDGSGAVIPCASYDVNGSSAASIGLTSAGGGSIYWKTWSSVTIPLKAQIGQTVKITFETRNCESALNAPGTHYAYAYIDANCDSLAIIPSSPAVCSGQTVTLTAPIGSPTYSWTGPGGATITNATTRIATVNTPGTYTVNMTTYGNTPCPYNITVTMPGSLPGSGVTVNSTTICSGASSILTASGGSPYLWAPGGATTTSITVSPGVGVSSYSVTGGGCPSTNVGTVTVNPIPTSPFTVTPVCVGVGSDITYTGGSGAADTYNWNFGSGTILSGSGQGPYKVSWSTSGPQNVTLQVTSNNCVSPVTTNTVAVNPPPSITITPSTICAGLKGTLTAAGASTYLWSDGTTPAAFTSATTLTITTTYSVTGTDAAGCTNTAVGTITVNQLDNPTFSYSPSTVCKISGTNPILSLTGTPGGTFSSTGALTIDPVTGAITTSSSPTGTYTITYTTNGPCPASSTFVVNIVNVPNADFHYGIFCQNVIPNPTPVYINGGSAGTFTEPTGNLKFINPIVTPGEVDLSGSTPGTYTVTNTISTAGCPLTIFDTTITINPVPITTVNSKTICAGSSTALTASGATSYVWAADNSILDSLHVTSGTTTPYTVTGTSAGCSSTITGTVTANPIPVVTVNNPVVCAGIAATMTASGATSYSWSTGFNADPLTINPAVAASYTVTGTSLGCSSTALATVTVNPLPIIGVNSPVVCQGLAATLTATGASTYLWNTGSNANPLVINPAVAANYTVTGTSAAGCTGTAVANVSITLLPVITVNAPVICLGQSAILTATGGATLTWSNGVTARSITVSPNATTTYTVADNTPGCSGSATGTVTVNQPPVIGANSATICLGQLASLLATGAVAYVWSNGSVANPLSVSPPTTTTYTVIGTNAAGCKDTTTTTVNVNQPPVVSVNPDTICARHNATLTASGAVSYLWSNNSTANPLNITALNNSTTYTVTGTDANGCSAPAAATVKVYPRPSADFSASPNPAIVSFPIITFTDQSSPNLNYWFWSFGDGDTLMPNTKSPVHTYPPVEATYNVTLIVHNAGMCFDTIVHQVVIGTEYSFFIPNAFTPDGDGINDTFFGKGKGIIEYELMIFDRWGNFIFYADDIDKGWDGKANGGAEVAQQDVYVWKVALTDVFKKKHNFIGTVTIVRGK